MSTLIRVSLFVCLAFCWSASAQSPAGISGTVLDASGAAMPGVQIQVSRGSTRLDTTSGASGEFRFDRLPIGQYQLSATKVGFTKKLVTLDVKTGAMPMEIRLDPASIAESVTVTAEGDSYKPESATTGTKLDLALIDTPQSVGVVTRKILEDRQALRLIDAAENVSGVRPGVGYGGLSAANFYIRGFRGSFGGGNLRNGFRDYTFLSPRDVQGIERIEFLKGPSSILYGQSEVGGIVNSITKKPLRQHRYEAGLQFGSFSLMRPTLDLTGPLTKGGSLLYRVNFAGEYQNGFRDYNKNRSLYLMPAISWRITPSTTFRIESEIQRYRYTFDIAYPAEPEFLKIPSTRFFGEPGISGATVRSGGISMELSHSFSDSWNLRTALNGLRSESLPRYVSPLGLQADRRTINRVAYNTDEQTDNYTFQNEVYGRFSTGPIHHNFVGGAEVVRWQFFYTFLFSPIGPINIDNPVYGTQPAGYFPLFGDKTFANILGTYVQDQITLTKKLKLLVGGRMDFVDQRSRDALTARRTNSRSTHNFAPRAGLLYNPTNTSSLYFSYTTSFFPQYGVSRTGERFDPQKGRQYEVGWKQNLVGDRMFATLALYRIWKENVATADPVDPRFSIVTGEQQSRGAEVDITGRLRRNWTVVANYALTSAFVSLDNRIRVGSKLVGIPKNSVGILTTYDIDRGALRGLTVGGGFYAIGVRQARLPNVPTLLPAYERGDLFFAYRRQHWKFQVNVKNVTDIRYFEAQGFNLYPQPPVHAVASIQYVY